MIPAPLMATVKELHSCVVQLFTRRGGQPRPVGSGFFVSRGDDIFVVSAAHVLALVSDVSRGIYYYRQKNTLTGISGHFKFSCPPLQAAKKLTDACDLGVVKLISESLPNGGDFVYSSLPSDRLKTTAHRSNFHFLVHGYPASQAKPNPVTRKINSWGMVMPFLEEGSQDEYAAMKVAPPSNLVLRWNRKNTTDENGQSVDGPAPMPNGMSGCPIWAIRIGSSLSIENVWPAGVLTDFNDHFGLLRGTDIHHVTEMIGRF